MIYRYEVGYYPDAQNFKIDVYSDVAKAANAILNSIKETKNKYFLYEVQYEDKEHLAKSEPKITYPIWNSSFQRWHDLLILTGKSTENGSVKMYEGKLTSMKEYAAIANSRRQTKKGKLRKGRGNNMENKKNFVISERIIDLLEKNDIQILCGISDSYENEYEIDLQFYSDAGEDFNFSLYDITDDASFIREFENYADFFDADEHASLYIENRGTHGIPNDIKTLIEDAESIKEKLQNVADELNGVENERGLTVDVTLDKEDLDILVSNGLITNRTDKEQVSNALLNAIRTDAYKQINEVKQIIKDTIEDITDENNIYIFDDLLPIDEDTVLKAFNEYTNHRDYYDSSFENCLQIIADEEYELAERSLDGFREIIESYIPERLQNAYKTLISRYDGRCDILYDELGLNNIYYRV